MPIDVPKELWLPAKPAIIRPAAARETSGVFFLPVTILAGGQTEIDRTLGTTIGNLVNGGGLAAAFDGNTNQAQTSSATLTSGDRTHGYVGKDWGAGNSHIVSGIVVYASNDQGFVKAVNPTVTIDLYGSNAGFLTSSVLLGGGTITDANSAIFTKLSGFTVSTAYRYHWIDITSDSGTTGTDDKICSECRFYEG